MLFTCCFIYSPLFAMQEREENNSEQRTTLTQEEAAQQIALLLFYQAPAQNVQRHNEQLESTARASTIIASPRRSRASGVKRRRVMSRNHARLTQLIEGSSPNRGQALTEEAVAFTPFLRNIYPLLYQTENPQNPSPEKPLGSHDPKNTKRKRKIENSEIRRIRDRMHSTARSLFQEGEYWDAIVEALEHTFYQRDGLINIWYQGENGDYNIERMMRGDAPIGPDNLSLELHHIIREPGDIVETTGSFHRRESGLVHPPGPGLGEVERSLFNDIRRFYWQARLCDILKEQDLYPI